MSPAEEFSFWFFVLAQQTPLLRQLNAIIGGEGGRKEDSSNYTSNISPKAMEMLYMIASEVAITSSASTATIRGEGKQLLDNFVESAGGPISSSTVRFRRISQILPRLRLPRRIGRTMQDTPRKSPPLGQVLRSMRGHSIPIHAPSSRPASRGASPAPGPGSTTNRHENSTGEELILYRTYCRQTRDPNHRYIVPVLGWVFQPGVNRKGRLMIIAMERLVGTPGKRPVNVSDHAIESEMGKLIDMDDVRSPSRSPTPRTSTEFVHHPPKRPGLLRSWSKPISRASSPAPSPPSSPSHSRPQSQLLRVPSSDHVMMDRGRKSAPGSPVRGRSPNPSPGPTFTPTSSHSGSSHCRQNSSQLYHAHHPHQHQHSHYRKVLRERMSAVAARSLAFREVCLLLTSVDGLHRREYWCHTDENGRFRHNCPLPWKPGKIHAICGSGIRTLAVEEVDIKGVSVITDIDDTIRNTGITGPKREVLQNVLLKDFEDVCVRGAPEWYRKLKDAGAAFHYVSNSPWQLYDSVLGFLQASNFPEGSIHLKHYQGLIDGMMEPAHGRKRVALETILRDFPERKFILIGDSGEVDLETYVELAKKFPDQVIAIYIRDITLPPDEPLSVYDKQIPRKKKVPSDTLIQLDGGTPPPLPERPPKPERPSYIRKKSSKFIGAMSNAASSAASSATSVFRSPAPSLPPRSQHRPKPPPTFIVGSREASPEDEESSRSSSLADVAPRQSGHQRVTSQPSPVVMPSSQDPTELLVEHPTVDKRIDHWIDRVVYNKRTLPEGIRLQMYRKPEEVEAETLRLVKGDKDSLL